MGLGPEELFFCQKQDRRSTLPLFCLEETPLMHIKLHSIPRLLLPRLFRAI